MRILYTIWCIFWLALLFIVLFPFVYLCLQSAYWKPYAHWLNRLWGKVFFFLAGIKIEIEYRYSPDPKQTYVFCANHFSYLDIAVMGVVLENYFAFVGKHDVKNIPLFGYMFEKLHIQVNRESGQSRVGSFSRAIKMLAQGRSIVIYPEGGIRTKKPPQMYPFMDGAFKMAIQQQVPVVPITLLTNYKILPDQKKLRLFLHPMRAVVHSPLSTIGLTQSDATGLKEKCFQIINETLREYHKS